jgi:probable rRNA maturation factor
MTARGALIVDCRVPARVRTPARRLMARWADAALGSRGVGHEMALLVVSAVRMRKLNLEYRGKDKPTNVLAFPASPAPGVRPRPLGDVVICPAVLRREAREQGKTETAHWAHLIVHGTLHLAGYDHERNDDAARMERREIAVMKKLGFANPYRRNLDPVGDRHG